MYIMTKLIAWIIWLPIALCVLYIEITSIVSIGGIITTINYYKYSFDQINDDLNRLPIVIFLTRIQTIKLHKAINEHQRLWIETNKLNLSFRGWNGFFFINFSIVETIMLNVIMQITDFIMLIVFRSELFLNIFKCFAIIYLFSIKTYHELQLIKLKTIQLWL